MCLSETIKTAREGLGLTQEDLAERLEVSRQAVSKWELDASVPSPENLRALSEILGVPLSLEADAAEPVSAPETDPSPSPPWKTISLVLGGLLLLLAALCCMIFLNMDTSAPAPEQEPILPAAPAGSEPAGTIGSVPFGSGDGSFSVVSGSSSVSGTITGKPPQSPEPAISGIYFYDEAGTPLQPDLGDGWQSFQAGQRVILVVDFRQGTEIGVVGTALFLTPTGTETYDQREQLAIQGVQDEQTFALFVLEIPENLMGHLDVTLECAGGLNVTETLNVTSLSPEATGEPDVTLHVGETYQMPQSGSGGTLWVSSNPETAAVTDSGEVTAKAPGMVRIHSSGGGADAEYIVRVVPS